MFSTIVVGTDGSDTAKSALAVAAHIARQNGATLHLVAVSRATAGVGGGGLASGAPIGDDGLSSLAAERMLEAAALDLADIETVTYAGTGSPATVIVRRADELGADLIVVGSKGMQGTRRILGSVPNGVAHNASCHVLIAKTT
jgi:nucleotide-binding universal stress UspA family protein